ncbi:MAG: hypothetical protein QG608_2318 [Actinomycetota bacterium]|nr:hypothetical protein [Actinomycetota bacterium]
MTTDPENDDAVFRPAPIVWAACPEDETNASAAECGSVTVPIDWSAPDGPTVGIAVVRKPATSGKRIGSLFLLPGGPGGSGVDAVLHQGQYFSELGQQFDLVGFDPRGVGRSHAVTCSQELIDTQPSPVLRNAAEFARAVAHSKVLGADCRKKTGPLFDHLDTVSVTHDLDAIRRALGEKTLSLFGFSYGTQVGLQYAELYGEHVRAMVADSTVDHSQYNPELLMTTSAAEEDAFDEFADWCDGSDGCPLHGADTRGIWKQLQKKADANRLSSPFDTTEPMDVFGLRSLARGLLNNVQWTDLARYMVAMNTGKTVERPGPEEPEPIAALAIACQDWVHGVDTYEDYVRYVDRAAGLAPDFGVSADSLAVTTRCVGWPTTVKNPQHPYQIVRGPSILLVNALHDPSTGYRWAQNVAGQLGGRGGLVTYEGWGHVLYTVTPCVDDAVNAYLTNLTMPRTGLRCPAVDRS